MGNILAAGASVFIPLINHVITVPYIFHPLRWGGIPWSEPNGLVIGIVTKLLNILMLMIAGTISGIMSTKRKCDRMDVYMAIKRSMWLILGYTIGNMVLAVAPFIKVPVLMFTIWLPYAGWIAHGLCVSAFVLLFGAMGNMKLRGEVC